MNINLHKLAFRITQNYWNAQSISIDFLNQEIFIATAQRLMHVFFHFNVNYYLDYY